MKGHSLSALVAAGLLAGGLTSTSASAADLGGNCCADLEERVAELEATVARKGNRKVSLTISGWVAEQVLWWDDGVESNAYVTGVGTTLSSHFKMTGEAQIRSGLTAGYVLHVEVNSAEPLAIDQNTDGPGQGVGILQSYWFLKDDKLGKVSIGQLSHASDNTAILVDGSGSLVPANWVNFDSISFRARSGGALLTLGGRNVTWGSVGFCNHVGAGIGGDCNGVPLNAVRYDSPTFSGFSMSASWGEDDFWDIAARYAGEFNGVKVAVAAAYSVQTDGTPAGGAPRLNSGEESEYFQIGAFVHHVATGLFVYGAYGTENNNIVDPLRDGAGGEGFIDGDHWYIKAGLRRKWSPLGHTVLYGEYQERNDMLDPSIIDATNATTASSDHRMWGLGIVQEVDAAAMSLWLTYRNLDADVTLDGAKTELDEFHIVKFGALINF